MHCCNKYRSSLDSRKYFGGPTACHYNRSFMSLCNIYKFARGTIVIFCRIDRMEKYGKIEL